MSDGDVTVEHGGITWRYVEVSGDWRWECEDRMPHTLAMVWREHDGWRYVTAAPGMSAMRFGTNFEAMDAAIVEVVAHRMESA
jgi:hypothetical protein